jgi:hypothetical protein
VHLPVAAFSRDFEFPEVGQIVTVKEDLPDGDAGSRRKADQCFFRMGD